MLVSVSFMGLVEKLIHLRMEFVIFTHVWYLAFCFGEQGGGGRNVCFNLFSV